MELSTSAPLLISPSSRPSSPAASPTHSVAAPTVFTALQAAVPQPTRLGQLPRRSPRLPLVTHWSSIRRSQGHARPWCGGWTLVRWVDEIAFASVVHAAFTRAPSTTGVGPHLTVGPPQFRRGAPRSTLGAACPCSLRPAGEALPPPLDTHPGAGGTSTLLTCSALPAYRFHHRRRRLPGQYEDLPGLRVMSAWVPAFTVVAVEGIVRVKPTARVARSRP